MSLKRKILIKGNHDILLEDCCMRKFPYSYDNSNGTTKTINVVCDSSSKTGSTSGGGGGGFQPGIGFQPSN